MKTYNLITSPHECFLTDGKICGVKLCYREFVKVFKLSDKITKATLQVSKESFDGAIELTFKPNDIDKRDNECPWVYINGTEHQILQNTTNVIKNDFNITNNAEIKMFVKVVDATI